MSIKLKRLRQSAKLRDLVRETSLSVNDLVYPLFIKQNLAHKSPIPSMPGQVQLGLTHLAAEIAEIVELKLPAVILFGIPEHKDQTGHSALAEDGVIQQAIKLIKKQAPELLVISDLCFCEYTAHGHCGVLTDHEQHTALIDNQQTLELLTTQAISHAKAGADIVAPSGMLDNMVASLRHGLDAAGFTNTPILSYAAKYCSAFYGPFREAAEGTPQFGDRASYQMDPANANEALREVALDIAEGVDMLMVKPALSYLDIIHRVKATHPEVPLCAYQVSGEYAMLKAASLQGWIDYQSAVLESVLSIKRAGADFIISYFAKELAMWL